MPNALDRTSVTEVRPQVVDDRTGRGLLTNDFQVMTVLLRRHGLNLMGVKTDLYTYIGI